MASKKWITIITFAISVALIPLILVFNKNALNLGYDIALAVFGGSSMGFIMTLVEYFSERRKAMEEFWSEANAVLSRLRKAKYIHFDEPEELVIASIKENDSNEYLDELGEPVYKAMGFVKSFNAKNRYIQWMEEHIPMSFSEEDDQGPILETLYSEAVKRNKTLIEEVIYNYIDLSQISLSKLDNAYGNLNFIFANFSIRTKAYDDIFNRIRDIRNNILKATIDFNLWKENKGNFAACMENAIKISHQLFSEEEKLVDGMKYCIVYQSEFDEIADCLEDFRTKIYIHAKNESTKHRPVMGRMIKFKSEKDTDEDSKQKI